MKPYISMITLGVKDLVRSRLFYEEGLGLARKKWGDHQDIIFFELVGSWLVLYPRELLAQDAGVPEEGSGFRGITLAHNVGSKTEVDATVERALRAGAKLVKKPQDVFWGGYSGYFADPDGFLWEVAWNPHF